MSNSAEEDEWQGHFAKLLKWSASASEADFEPLLWAGARLFGGSRCPLPSCAPVLVKSGNVSVLKNVISLSHSLPKCQAGSALL